MNRLPLFTILFLCAAIAAWNLSYYTVQGEELENGSGEAVGDSELMVRVGPQAYEEAVRQPHARKMDFTGRPMKGFVYVASDGFESDADLHGWIDRGVRFAGSLPTK